MLRRKSLAGATQRRVTAMSHATFSLLLTYALSPSPFRALPQIQTRALVPGPWSSIMIGLVRAATFCATLALGLVTAQAADKTFRRDDLADSALKLEAQIKSEAGALAKTNATLKTDADAAFKRSDFRTGLQILGQIAAVTPEDSANWLRLARTIFQIKPSNSTEQTFLFERASTAAYIAYQRAANPGDEADALAVLGRAMSERKLWRAGVV